MHKKYFLASAIAILAVFSLTGFLGLSNEKAEGAYPIPSTPAPSRAVFWASGLTFKVDSPVSGTWYTALNDSITSGEYKNVEMYCDQYARNISAQEVRLTVDGVVKFNGSLGWTQTMNASLGDWARGGHTVKLEHRRTAIYSDTPYSIQVMDCKLKRDLFPEASISVTPSTVELGKSAVLNWSGQYYDTCVGTGFDINRTIVQDGLNTIIVTPVLPLGTKTYGIKCTNTAGDSPVASTSITLVEPASLILNVPDTVEVTVGESPKIYSISAEKVGVQMGVKFSDDVLAKKLDGGASESGIEIESRRPGTLSIGAGDAPVGSHTVIVTATGTKTSGGPITGSKKVTVNVGLPTPKGFTATTGQCIVPPATTGSIALKWDEYPGATSFNVKDSSTSVYTGLGRTPTITGLARDSEHIYYLTAETPNGTSPATTTGVVYAPGYCANGKLQVTDCFISEGANTCTPAFTWEVFNPTVGATTQVRRIDGTIFFSGLSGENQMGPTIYYGTTPFRLWHDGKEIVSADAVAKCNSTTTWNSALQKCVAQPITPYGSIIAKNCEIPKGSSTCPASITWEVKNDIAGALSGVTKDRDSTGKSVSNQNVFGYEPGTDVTSQGTLIYYSAASGSGPTTFYLYHNEAELGSSSATASCELGSQWNGTICAPLSSATGSLTMNPSCTIDLNASTCQVNASWTTSGAIGAYLYDANTGETLYTANSNSNFPVWVSYPNTTFHLKNGSTNIVLDTEIVNATCASGSWDGSKCAAGISKPDVTAGSVSPSVVTHGTPTTFSTTVTNSGSAPTGSGFATVFEVASGPNGEGTRSFVTASTPALNSGGKSTVSISYTFYIAGLEDNLFYASGLKSFDGFGEDSSFLSVLKDIGTVILKPGIIGQTAIAQAQTAPVCAATHNNCTAGSMIASSQTATQWEWTCTLNGQYANCTEAKPPVCAATHNNCTVGTMIANSQTATQWEWTCVSGSQYANCTEAKPPVCAATHNNCTAGSMIANSQTSTHWEWTCVSGSQYANCTEAKPPVCAATHNNCTAGSMIANSQTATHWEWTCTLNSQYANCTEAKPPVCAATHNNCTAGSMIASSQTATQWEWTCTLNGQYANCTEAKPLLSPTGSLSIGTCVIAIGSSSCNPTFTWSVSNPVSGATTQVRRIDGTVAYTGVSGTNQTSHPVAVGTTPYTLIHNGVTLASADAVATCASGSAWSNGSCVANSISASLSVSPTSCTIANGASTCTVEAGWSSSGTSLNLFDANVNSILYSSNSVSGFTVWVAYPNTTFHLRNGTSVLDTKLVGATCASGSTWSNTLQKCITATTTPGTYSIRACADHYGSITESIESNNCGPWTNISVVADLVDPQPEPDPGTTPEPEQYVPPPSPTSSIAVNPTSIVVGDSATLSWYSSNTTSCTGTNFSTGNATEGSISVNPIVTTTYTVLCVGDGGQTYDTVTLLVTTPEKIPIYKED